MIFLSPLDIGLTPRREYDRAPHEESVKWPALLLTAVLAACREVSLRSGVGRETAGEITNLL